ncbi:transposase [Roseiflexus sp.]|uniref:transposase n=1 Tax=Roseiflexus sp. TaxID=2562120 RepID=UPI00398AA2E7
MAQPNLQRWADADHERHLIEKTVAKTDPDPKALACYGLLLPHPDPALSQLLLRFAAGQPVSDLTIQFLSWCCDQLAAQGKRALLLVWENASWHKSAAVRHWLRAHHQRVKRDGVGVRVVAYRLPTNSPWLNPMEPRWVHGKRAVLEPERVLSAAELEARVYASYRCNPEPQLHISEKVT